MELRNPFGLRGDRVVLIEDISKQENGLKCNCVCPACKEPFEAKMGDIRRHHFAHSGQGCDEVNAYMAGLYMLLSEYISGHEPLYIPPVVACYRLSPHYCITESNIRDHVSLRSFSDGTRNEIVICNEVNICFDSAEIIKDSKDKPQAIIAEKSGHILAVRITPPDTVCKWGEVSRYKDYPTLEVDLSHSGETIQTSNKQAFIQFLRNQTSIYSWIYNPKVQNAYPEIIRRSKKYYEKVLENRRINEERKAKEAEMRKKQMELGNQSSVEEDVKPLSRYSSFSAREIERKRKLRKGFEEVKDRFSPQADISVRIKDSFGTRWLKCGICGAIKPSEEFGMYGGQNEIIGTCKECCRKRQ